MKRKLKPLWAVACIALLGMRAGAAEEDWMSATDGVYQYKRVHGKWVRDEAAEKAISDEENRKRELMTVLQSRLLTEGEMAEVVRYGRRLFIYSGEVYFEADKQRELNEALLQQFRLRLEASRLKVPHAN